MSPLTGITRPTTARFVKALFFGPYGHGKTHLCGTAQEDPRTSPALFLNFEGGDQTLAGLDIEQKRILTWGDYNEVYAVLTQEDHHYKSIIIDSISETHIFALMSILDREKGTRGRDDMIQIQDYGQAQIQLRRFLRTFRDLDVHVFMTSQSKDYNEPKEGWIKKPALAGQLAEEMPGIMDVVAYIALQTNQEGETERLLLLKNYPKFRVKTRTPWGATDVPDEIVNPTISKLLDVLHIPMTEESE